MAIANVTLRGQRVAKFYLEASVRRCKNGYEFKHSSGGSHIGKNAYKLIHIDNGVTDWYATPDCEIEIPKDLT